MNIASKENSIGTYIDNGIDLGKLFFIVWQHKQFIFLTALCFSIIGLIYALLQPNLYKSETLVNFVEGENNRSGIENSIKKIVNLGSALSTNKTVPIVIETVNSHVFLINFINKHNLKPFLIKQESTKKNATKSNTLLSDWLAVNSLRKKLNITEDKRGFLKISVSNESPNIAYEWVNQIIISLNDYLRQKAIKEAEIKINHFQEHLGKTSLTSMQEVFYNLIETQIGKKLHAESSPEYVIQTIVPAIIPQKPFAPNKKMIVFASGGGGAFLSIIFIFLKRFYKSFD